MKKFITSVLLLISMFVVVGCSNVEYTNEQLQNEIKIDLLENESINNITTNIGLVDIVFDKYYVKWTSSHSAIQIIDNKLGKVVQNTEDISVKLTGVIVIDEELILKDFDLTVKGNSILEPEPEPEPEPTFNKHQENFSRLINDIKSEGIPTSEYIQITDYEINDIIYSIVNFRTDLGINESSPKTITLAGKSIDNETAGRGYLKTSNLKSGLSEVSFFARLPFSELSKYPFAGKDDAKDSIITFKVYKNNVLVSTEQLSFENNKEANKGKIFHLQDINVKGNVSFVIEINSGKRLTISDLTWYDYYLEEVENKEILKLDFEDLSYLTYLKDPETILLNNSEFVVKQFWSNYKNIHGEKELPYLTEKNNNNIARLRGNDNKDYFNEPGAYIYNKTPFTILSKISFDARQFGEEGPYLNNGIIKIYYQNNDEWILIPTDINLNVNFNTYEVEVNKQNCILKIEVTEGTINIDNIIYYE